MNELKQIIQAYRQFQSTGISCVLATLVKVRGSHYRKAGAKVLISEVGDMIGAISGGCMETDLKNIAKKVIVSGESRLTKYDSTSSEEIVFGLGVGCGGVVEILVEPIGQNGHPYLDAMCEMLTHHNRLISAVIYSSNTPDLTGGRLVLSQNECIWSNIENETIKKKITFWMNQVSSHSNNINTVIETEYGPLNLNVFCDFISPSIHLLIIGGGNDAMPLVYFAKKLGWDITIADHRPSYATLERFPDADRVIVTPSETILENLNFENIDAVIILTHNFLNDLALLKILLPMELPYLGLLGARKRTQNLLSEVENAEIMSIDDAKNKLFAPVGLDIGSDTPEEIALAIVSEIKAVLSGRDGGSLRNLNCRNRDAQRKEHQLEAPCL